MKLLFAAIVSFVSLGAASTDLATGWDVLMKNSPMEDFTQGDLRQHFDLLYAALNAPIPVVPIQWHNGRTGSGARIEVLGQHKLQNLEDCRRVWTNTYSNKRKNLTRICTACRGANGNWSLVSAN